MMETSLVLLGIYAQLNPACENTGKHSTTKIQRHKSQVNQTKPTAAAASQPAINQIQK
jgi:hypothetical protein